MDELPVSLLGLVDDVIGVTEAAFRAQQLNAILNVKTAEKGLQYGVKKCKYMIVGKDLENSINSELLVDGWSQKYVDSSEMVKLSWWKHTLEKSLLKEPVSTSTLVL